MTDAANPTPWQRPRRLRWVVTVCGLVVATALIVLAARWAVVQAPIAALIERYPGTAALPPAAPVGIPPWLAWQHFLNALILVLIVRTGLAVRAEKVPQGLWTSRSHRRRRMSLTLWTHQALDVLWMTNGAIYVALLALTGQWMRIVPTSPDTFAHATSALLQYLSLEWPVHRSWTAYNALQQLAYSAVVFVASPLAILSGWRLSAWWPARLDGSRSRTWAKRVHFPVMLFFVAFTVVHAGLVFTTGWMRNLSHMYAAREDAGVLGLFMFVLSVLAIAAAWAALRPTVSATVARQFGEVRVRP